MFNNKDNNNDFINHNSWASDKNSEWGMPQDFGGDWNSPQNADSSSQNQNNQQSNSGANSAQQNVQGDNNNAQPQDNVQNNYGQLNNNHGWQNSNNQQNNHDANQWGSNNSNQQNNRQQPNNQNQQNGYIGQFGQFVPTPFPPAQRPSANLGALIAAVIIAPIGIFLCFLNLMMIPVVHLVGMGLGIAALSIGASQSKRQHRTGATRALSIISIVLGSIAMAFGITLASFGCFVGCMSVL